MLPIAMPINVMASTYSFALASTLPLMQPAPSLNRLICAHQWMVGGERRWEYGRSKLLAWLWHEMFPLRIGRKNRNDKWRIVPTPIRKIKSLTKLDKIRKMQTVWQKFCGAWKIIHRRESKLEFMKFLSELERYHAHWPPAFNARLHNGRREIFRADSNRLNSNC